MFIYKHTSPNILIVMQTLVVRSIIYIKEFNYLRIPAGWSPPMPIYPFDILHPLLSALQLHNHTKDIKIAIAVIRLVNVLLSFMIGVLLLKSMLLYKWDTR